MSSCVVSIRPLPPNVERDELYSEIQVEPEEVDEFFLQGTTAFLVFKSQSIAKKVEFLNGADVCGAVVIVQQESQDALYHAKHPEQASFIPKPTYLDPRVQTPSAPLDGSLLSKLQEQSLPARAKLPDEDAFSVLRNNFGLVTLAILTILSLSSLLG